MPPLIFRENRSHFTDRENGVTPFSFESRLRYNTSADDGCKRQRVPPPIHPFVFHQLDTTSQWIFSCEIGQRENLSEKGILIEERDVVGRIFSGESTGIDSKFEYIYISEILLKSRHGFEKKESVDLMHLNLCNDDKSRERELIFGRIGSRNVTWHPVSWISWRKVSIS